MMKSISFKTVIILIAGILVPFLSCRKFVEVESPVDRLVADKVFNNEKNATSAVAGIYSAMILSAPIITSGSTTIYMGLYSDELYSTSTAENNTAFFNNSLTSLNDGDFWVPAYKFIYQANVCIEGISASTVISPAVSRQLIGEAKFIRAFLYFYLTNLYGDVPLITTTDFSVNANMARTSSSLVLAQVVTDLKEAKELLQTTYPSSGRVRANKWAATALLARVYLYLKDWNNAELLSDEIISTAGYQLLTNLDNVFLAGSDEAILQVIPVSTGFNTTEARYFVPTTSASSRPINNITAYLLNSFETNDKRKASWVKSKIVSGQTYYYPYKYKIRDLNLPVTEYYMFLRYAEQYLIRSEARAHKNNIAAAIADLNILRQRAGLQPLDGAMTNEQCLLAIEHERQTELFAEWGHRWFDLKRTNRANTVLAPIKSGWGLTDTLLPIPRSQILLNPNLSQNPGYN